MRVHGDHGAELVSAALMRCDAMGHLAPAIAGPTTVASVAQHALLKSMVGTWNATVKQWTGGPEPTVTKGTMKNEMMFGGRYLESKYKGVYEGKPFEGYGLTGYDTRRNQLISFWVDDMSTSWMCCAV